MLLFIDNFDSFTYNLVQAFQMLNMEVKVVRSGALSIDACLAFRPRYVVIGPGPGSPQQALFSKSLMAYYAGKLPLLGICLGHQILAELYGGQVKRATIPMHGKTSPIFHQSDGLFYGLPQGFDATRYHSLIVEELNLPDCLSITAKTGEGELMGLKHRDIPFLESVQFHPESILTPCGPALLQNFLDNPRRAI